MTARTLRRAMVSGAVALALVGAGAGTAFATTDVTDSWFAGPLFLFDSDGWASIAPGDTVAWSSNVLAVSTEGDPDSSFTVPAGAYEFDVFIAPRGHENIPDDWNAWQSGSTTPGAVLSQASVWPDNLGNAGNAVSGGPKGKDNVKSTGGNYSLGIAYRGIGGGPVISANYAYITVTPVTGAYTYEDLSKAVVKTPTTTQITSSPSTAVTSGEDFTLSATVAGAGATGTVLFKNGTTTIGTATLSGGVATTTTASIGNATTAPISASITAQYQGDPSFAASTSDPVTIPVNPGPITTTTTVTATSVSGIANRPVVLKATVTGVISAAAGSVEFFDAADNLLAGPIQVGTDGIAQTTITSLVAGSWEISAEFTGVSPYVDSASTTPAELTLASAPVILDQPRTSGDVTVTIPAGTVAITTPYTTAEPLALGEAILDDATSTYYTDPVTIGEDGQEQGIQVIDRRSGGNGFTASLESTDFASGANSFAASYASLKHVVAHQVDDNTLDASAVVTSEIAALSSTAQPFATYDPAAGRETGTVWFSADYALNGIPSSVHSGDYKATLTFTVL